LVNKFSHFQGEQEEGVANYPFKLDEIS